MRDKVFQLLDSINIRYRLIEHPAVFTVADAARLPGDIKPIKNLLLQEDGGESQFLVVTNGTTRLDLKSLRNKLGSKRLRFVSNETLFKTFGVSPGSVSIFGLLHDGSSGVRVIIDKELLKEAELSFHPNENTSTVVFATKDLDTILSKLSCDYTYISLMQ